MFTLSQRNKKAIIQALREDEQWVADILLDLLQIHQVHNKEGDSVRWVDPGFFTLVATGSLKHRHYERNFKELYALLHEKGPETLLIPIHGEQHWSLLVYRRLHKHWYVCDSAGGYHRKQIELVLLNLCKRGFITDNNSHVVTFYDDLAQQKSNFECGFFTLLYCLVFASNKNKTGTEEGYNRYLSEELAKIDENMRLKYRDELIDIVNSL
jgi:hypothetical protein